MNRDNLAKALHLPLTSLSEQDYDVIVPGETQGATINVYGPPTVEVDREFGSAASFNPLRLEQDDGGEDYGQTCLQITEVAFEKNFCAGVWLKADATAQIDIPQSLLTVDTGQTKFEVLYHLHTGDIILQEGGKARRIPVNIKPGVWCHILVRCSTRGAAYLSVNGAEAVRVDFANTFDFPTGTSVFLGGNRDFGDTPGFCGRLTHFRLFPKFDWMDDTKIHSLDRVPTENFRSYAPLDVSITDEKQRPFLYVEGGEVAHRMMLSIWNRDPNGETIVLNQLSAAQQPYLDEYRAIAPYADLLDATPEARTAALAKMNAETRTRGEARLKQFKGYGGGRLFNYIGKFFEENHHFELRFASPVLSKETKNWLLRSLLRAMSRNTNGEDLWYICPAPNTRGPDAPDRLLLMAANARDDLQPQGSASAPPDLRIALAHIATVSEVEAQVIPIELRPGPLTRRASDFARLGPSIQLLEVQSQVGQLFVPLNFSTVGANQVINDDIEETFVLLRLSNIDRENDISIDRVGNLQTVFSLSCELTKPDSHEDWALSDEPAKVQLWVKPIAGPGDPAPDPDNPGDWLEDPLIGHSDGRHLVWEFDGHHLGDVPLSPDASVYMRLSVITGQRTGPAALHLKYRHIPGYWDGVRQINITKSPLVADWNHDASDNRVGIGTAKPGSKLGVTEGVSVGAHYASDVLAPPNGLAVEGRVVIGADTPNTNAQLHVEGGRIHLNQPYDSAVVELSNGKTTNYVCTDGSNGHLIASTESKAHHVLLQPGGGFVGIGKMNTPKHQLEVAGRIKGVLNGEDILNLSIPQEALERAVQSALCPVGSIMPYAADLEPNGWLMCHGEGYKKAEWNKALFDKIGYRFGNLTGDPDYFKVPDLRGLFLRGRSGNDLERRDPDRDDRKENKGSRSQGAVGNRVGSIQGHAIAAHEHTYVHTTGENRLGDHGGSSHFSVDARVPTSTTEGGKEKDGFNGGKETRPRNMYVNFIIKF